jgi:D-alanyl-D-alanine-carboxypeptidase/D-alanyl-D-alanine-endopeptidase
MRHSCPAILGDKANPMQRTMMRALAPMAPAVAALLAALALPPSAKAEDKLLDHSIDFAGTLTFLAAKVPGLVFVGVRHGQSTVAGFGEVPDGSGKPPDGNTMVRIGSVSKVFCGQALASLVVDGKIGLSDRLEDRLGFGVAVPEKDGKPVRIIDLVTQSAGFVREVPRPDATADDPFGTNTRAAQIAGLRGDPLMFAPGTAISYSNYGFDLLGAALSSTAGQPYASLLAERVLSPLGMKDTVFNPRPGDGARLMVGHDFDGKPMPVAPTPETIECAGGLYTTPNDMAKWMSWHLDRLSAEGAAVRLVDHATYLSRNGLDAAVGMDDAGEMDAMGLGWVVLMPDGHRPLILQKSGGLQGSFAYVALAPTKGVGVFFAMNAFSIGGYVAAVEATNKLVAELSSQ